MNKNTKIIAGVATAVVVIIIAVMVFSNKTTVSTPNGDVQIDRDGDTVTVNTNEASLEVGEQVSLPSDFPTDVHVADGTLQAAFKLDSGNAFSVSLISNDSVTDLKSEYQSEMKNDGWTVLSSLDLPTGSTIAAEKDNRMFSVSMSQGDDGATNVVISTSTDTEE